MESILGKRFQLGYFDPYGPNHLCPDSDYVPLLLRSYADYLNTKLQAKGYLTLETIATLLGVDVTPEEIEQTSVLRYSGQRITFAHEFHDGYYYVEVKEVT